MVQTIPVRFITPAEAQVLSVMHKNGAGGPVILDVALTDDVPRDSRAELARLRHKYGTKAVDPLWPGLNPQLPQTFADVGLQAGAAQVVAPPVPADLPPLDAPPVETAPAPEPPPAPVDEPVAKPAPKKFKKTLP